VDNKVDGGGLRKPSFRLAMPKIVVESGLHRATRNAPGDVGIPLKVPGLIEISGRIEIAWHRCRVRGRLSQLGRFFFFHGLDTQLVQDIRLPRTPGCVNGRNDIPLNPSGRPKGPTLPESSIGRRAFPTHNILNSHILNSPRQKLSWMLWNV